MARESTKAEFPFVMDLGAEQTAAYSVDGFSTYVIGKKGNVEAQLTGTKMVRPSAEDVLGKVRKTVGPETPRTEIPGTEIPGTAQ